MEQITLKMRTNKTKSGFTEEESDQIEAHVLL